MKDMLQEALEAELSEELGYEKHEKDVVSENSRNGYSKKKVKSSYGEIGLNISNRHIFNEDFIFSNEEFNRKIEVRLC